MTDSGMRSGKYGCEKSVKKFSISGEKSGKAEKGKSVKIQYSFVFCKKIVTF